MKPGWELKTLSEVCRVFTDGNWIETKDQSAEGIRLVQTGNVGLGIFKDRRDKARFISETTFSDLKCFEVFPGDCLISRLPDPVGRACEIPETKDRMITAVDCSIVRADPQKMDRNYFIYLSQSRAYLNEVDSLCSGTTRRRISRKNLGKITIPLPPLDEQKRIVSILDEAFEGLDRARENAEANLKSARELFDRTANSQLKASSETKRVALGDVASIPSSLVDPKLPEFLDQPHVGAGNMVTGRDVLIDVKTSREEGLKSGKYTFDGNMVLYSKIRPYLRKVARPDFIGLCSADMYPLLPDSSLLDKDYLFHLLLSDDFTSYAIAGSDRAGMPKVNQTHLFKYQFSLPSIKSQKIVVQTIDLAMEKSELLQTDYRTKLQDISDLRQSLLQKAFAGELT